MKSLLRTVPPLIYVGAVVAVGCSKAADKSAPPQTAPLQLPFTVQVVETPELLHTRQLRKEARELFLARNFDRLEQLATEYRESKQTSPSGVWKLVEIYGGIVIPQGSTDPEWEAHLGDLKRWANARPESITARVCLARALTSYAWKARGGAYADSVSETQFKLFGERLDEARKVLLEARKLKARCPVWWSALMKVALGLGMEKTEYDAMFNQALTEYPGYTYYYCSRAWFLLPRWYGDAGEWEHDLKKSADLIGGEDGDLLYAQVVWDMQGYHQNVFAENKLSWARVDKGLAVMEQRYPDSSQPKNVRAMLACLGADRKTARKYVERLEGKVDLMVWDSEKGFRALAQKVYQD